MKTLVVSIALLCAAGCVTEPVSNGSQSVGARDDVRYECYTYVGSNHVLTLPVAPLNSEVGTVTVMFHGDPKEARYVRKGLKQIWFFERNVYLELNPDFTGAYYDFAGAEEGERRKPEAVFKCTKKGS